MTIQGKEHFWHRLPQPFFALAPMADVTDVAFRSIIAKYSKTGEQCGGPDIFWTEFVSADGLMSAGREVLQNDLRYSEKERPIVAQLFGSNPETMEGAARLCTELGFDGIDINMGCPDRSIEKQGAGAAMIKNPEQAKEIIQSAQRGGGGLPVSVKTRLGYNTDELEEWLPVLLETGVSAVTIHARTRKEMSKVPARFERIKRAVEIRDALNSNVLIIANGDVTDVADAQKKAEETGCDGVMLGRAIFGNPWLFRNVDAFRNSPEQAKRFEGYIPSVKEKLTVMTEHTELFEKLLGDVKNFAIMKKHYKAYVEGFDGAKELRMRLMEAENSKEVRGIIDGFLSNNACKV